MTNINLQDAIKIRQAMAEYRDAEYIKFARQIKERTDNIFNDDMGSQFVKNCGRDLAGEIIRNLFDTSDYHITVDQLAIRILEFNYDNEYDPLKTNTDIQKNVYNYNTTSSILNEIYSELDACQEKLFKKNEQKKYVDKNLIRAGKEKYRSSVENQNGETTDEYTGKTGEYYTDKTGTTKPRQEVDHVQAAATAKYNSKYISENGINALKQFYNSPDNFAMMDKSANSSKGDVKVFEKNGRVLTPEDVRMEKNKIEQEFRAKTGTKPSRTEINEEFNKRTTDVTHRATSKQLADAICDRWETAKNKKELTDKGYLNEDGKVPKSVRNELVQNLHNSQNEESKIILKNTDIKKVAEHVLNTDQDDLDDDLDKKKNELKKTIGKIIAGQILYYATPPIVYEIKLILSDKHITIENAIEKLSAASKRIIEYVFAHLKDIFKNVVTNSIKSFIKSFMDILIGMVKETVKKLLTIAKSLVMATIDAIRIISDSDSTATQKADSVFNLFGVTVTNIVLEILFEALENGTHIPSMVLKPLEILTRIICTNFTMLILQKLDLFDVRFGFKIDSVKKVFAEERENYNIKMQQAETYADTTIDQLIECARQESIIIYNNLICLDPKKQSARDCLESINQMFNIKIDFETEWLKFIGIYDFKYINA